MGKHEAGGCLPWAKPAQELLSSCTTRTLAQEYCSRLGCGISEELNKALGSVGVEVSGASGGALRAFLSLWRGTPSPSSQP